MVLTKKRDSFFDGLKFVLITLVVLGHAIAPVTYIHPVLVTYDFIYFFHMPLFVFVSGYFTKKKTDMKSFWQSTFRLLETFIVFMVLNRCHKWITVGVSLKSLLMPAWTLWYLLSLIYWRIMIQFTPDKILSSKKLVLCVSVILSVLIVSVRFNGYILSYQRTFGLLPFFIAGYYAKQTDIVNKIKKINPAICICVLVGIIITLILLSNETDFFLRNLSYFDNNRKFDNIPNDAFSRMQLRVMMLVIATVMSVCVINVCQFVPDSWKSIGQNTMLFYIYHGLLLQLFRFPSIYSRIPLVTTVGRYFTVFVIVMIMLFVMDKFKIFHLLINPVTNLYKYITRKR